MKFDYANGIVKRSLRQTEWQIKPACSGSINRPFD